MCGIAGVFSYGAGPGPLRAAFGMTRAMRHRGPDGEGYVLCAGAGGGVRAFWGPDTPPDTAGPGLPWAPTAPLPGVPGAGDVCALGHRRLAIVDLSRTGHQPMSSPDGRYWMVYNGEIYNAADIALELRSLGEDFLGSSDSEVLLRAFARWGEGCLERLNGMFAFAVWDSREGSLFLARDRMGIKPLFYLQAGGVFAFASELRALAHSGLFRPEPDWECVYHSMSFRCAPRPLTCVRGVRALRQGHWLRLDAAGQGAERRWWSIPLGPARRGWGMDQWAEALRATLDAAVGRRLVADVPVSVFMSGGLDSTTIAALAARRGARPRAFTLRYGAEAPELDEAPQAEAMAAMWSLPHVLETMRPEEALECLPDMLGTFEEPFHMLAPQYMISRLVAVHGFKVALNGLGGDELFCGYGRERLLALWKRLRPAAPLLARIPPYTDRLASLREVAALPTLADAYVFSFAVFSEEVKRGIFGPMARHWNSGAAFRELYGLDELEFEDPIQALGYFDLVNYIGNHHTGRDDLFTMHFSIESRFPFLDHEVVSLAMAMPSEFKVREGRGKAVLRSAARGLVHAACLEMPKKGFGLPLRQWMQGALAPLVSSRLDALLARGVLPVRDVAQLRALVRSTPMHWKRMWFFVHLEIWLETMFDAAPAPTFGEAA